MHRTSKDPLQEATEYKMNYGLISLLKPLRKVMGPIAFCVEPCLWRFWELDLKSERKSWENA